MANDKITMLELRRLDEVRLNRLLQPRSSTPQPDERKEELDQEPDYYLTELKKPYVSILLLWEEYHEAYPNGYRQVDRKLKIGIRSAPHGLRNIREVIEID